MVGVVSAGLHHSAVTNVYRATRDLFRAQRFARVASPLTTIVEKLNSLVDSAILVEKRFGDIAEQALCGE